MTPARPNGRSPRRRLRLGRRQLVVGIGALLLVVTLGPNAPSASATRVDRQVVATAVELAAPLPAERFARRLSAEVYGFLPYWEIDGGTDAYLRHDLLTDIALFSVTFTPSGEVAASGPGYADITSATVSTIVERAHAAGVRVDLTVTSFGFDKNAAFFSDPVAMATAAGSISSFVAGLGLDGVNLDVESLYSANFAAYGTFVGQLRAALQSRNPAARVSVATNASTSGASMAVAALANGADRVFLMGYNYRSAGAPTAGSIAPIVRADGDKSLTWSLDLYASRGIPADRIHLGLPYYGRTWHTTSGAPNATTTSSHGTFIPADEMALIPPGTAIGHDPLEATRWFAVQDAAGTWHQTYFDDGTTLRAKYDLATRRGLAGVGIWTLGYDEGIAGYWEAIAASFGTVRVAGTDRYATAAAIAGDTFTPGVALAYVATGTAFPDALAAAAAAGAGRAPVLLVNASGIPQSTLTQLARLQPARIVVVGGPGAVPDEVLAMLATMAPLGASRVFGQDRFATAAAVSAATFPFGAPVVYVTTGTGFPDAVSAAPAAARDGGPVLLAKVDLLPAPTLAELVRLAPARVVIVGGTGTVGDSVVAAIQAALPAAAITRLAGSDRYATSAAVAATFPAGAPILYAASGLGFPDAIAAAAAAGSQAAPMVLTDQASLPESIRAEILRLRPARAVVAGGVGAVSEAALAAIRAAVAGP